VCDVWATVVGDQVGKSDLVHRATSGAFDGDFVGCLGGRSIEIMSHLGMFLSH
jgi:hypothetical protein